MITCDQVRERLAEFLCGGMSTDEAAQVEQHLNDCATCQAEHAAIARVRHALDEVQAPSLEIDLARLYRAASESDQRGRRRWRKAALGLAAVLAASLLVVLCTKVEVRCEAHQLVVRWGTALSPASNAREKTLSTAASEVAGIKFQAEELGQRLNILNELVHALATDVADRDTQRSASIAQLKRRIEDLQRAAAEHWTDNRRDIQALYASQFGAAKTSVNR